MIRKLSDYMAAVIRYYVWRYVIRIYSPGYIRYIVKHRRIIWRFIAGYSAVIMAFICEVFHII